MCDLSFLPVPLKKLQNSKRTFKAVFVNYDGVILRGFGQTEELASVEEEKEINV